MGNVVEVRFDCEPLSLTREQVEGILKAHDGTLDIDVGLGYGGKAAATFDAIGGTNAKSFGEQVAQTARQLGLTVVGIEVLTEQEYVARAWDEAEVDPNG